MVGDCRRFRPACLRRMVGARRRLRSADFGPPPRCVGGGELGPELGRLHPRSGQSARLQRRPPRVVRLVLGPRP
eukprot:4032684-Alexandrium_andersonii.AAC.1